MFIGRSTGLVVNDLLGKLGIPGGQLGAQIDMLSGNPIGVLKNLQDAYQEAALGRGTTRFERVLGGAIPPFGAMPSPMSMLPMMSPLSGMGYAGAQRIDLAPGASRIFSPEGRAAAKFERLLNTNPFVRASFEAQVGGTYVPDGRRDGRITIQRFAPGFAPIPGFAANPMANTTLGMLAGMEQSVLGQAGKLGLLGAGLGGLAGLATGNPFGGLVLGGLGGLAMGALGGGLGLGGIGGGGFLPPGGGFGFGFPGFGGGSLGGIGAGSWNPLAMPGRINNTNPGYEAGHQAEVNSVLSDPSLTVEDKVTLMLMLIMKKMDKDIERQMQYINSIQQQQSNRGGKGGGGGKLGGIGSLAGGAIGGPAGKAIGGMAGNMLGGAMGGGDGNAPSIDVETTKLKRMIDKRSQMFDMLRQIIDKYNETAKGMIQSIGR